MRRYAETFLRYWLILLIPIVLLPLADGIMIKERPKTVLTSAKIWVEPSSVSSATDYNQYLTPAQNETDALNQLLLISSFDWKVAQGSPIYRQKLRKMPFPRDYVSADLQKNVQFSAPGTNLVYIGYTSQNWALGVQVVRSLLANAIVQFQQLNQQQTTTNMSVYTAQLRSAQQHLDQSTHALSVYMRAHNIVTPNDVSMQQAADLTFASLYTQVQSDQQTVQNLRQRILDLQTQTAGNRDTGQVGYHVADPPTVTVVSSKKKELMEIAIYMVIGLVVSAGFVVAKTLRDRSLRYADEVPDALDLPVLAVLPYDLALAASRRRESRPRTDSLYNGRSGQRQIG